MESERILSVSRVQDGDDALALRTVFRDDPSSGRIVTFVRTPQGWVGEGTGGFIADSRIRGGSRMEACGRDGVEMSVTRVPEACARPGVELFLTMIDDVTR